MQRMGRVRFGFAQSSCRTQDPRAHDTVMKIKRRASPGLARISYDAFRNESRRPPNRVFRESARYAQRMASFLTMRARMAGCGAASCALHRVPKMSGGNRSFSRHFRPKRLARLKQNQIYPYKTMACERWHAYRWMSVVNGRAPSADVPHQIEPDAPRTPHRNMATRFRP